MLRSVTLCCRNRIVEMHIEAWGPTGRYTSCNVPPQSSWREACRPRPTVAWGQTRNDLQAPLLACPYELAECQDT